ncbi:MAG: PhzF family phenazine biosynthesis protein, partial [Calditrichaeota bacterium]
MKKHVFYIVDVFAEKKYSGNQLAVIGDAHDLSSESMQEISREMNYSETTFITALHQSESNFDVRIFTPAEEVPFAGHPTLGTAFIIQTEILKKPVDILHLNLKVGRIPVTFEYSGGKAERLWMKQNAPVFSQRLDIASIAKILNLKTDQIDSRFPIEEVSTGLPFIIVPLKNLQAVRRSSIQKDKFFDLIRNTAAKAILVFSPECYDPQNHLNVRV